MLCAKCNYDNPADALFCMKCGTKVENRCSPVTPCWLTPFATLRIAEQRFCDLQNARSSPREALQKLIDSCTKETSDG